MPERMEEKPSSMVLNADGSIWRRLESTLALAKHEAASPHPVNLLTYSKFPELAQDIYFLNRITPNPIRFALTL